MQRPDVLVKLGYIWRHVCAVNRPSSGQQGIVLLSTVKLFAQWDPIVYINVSSFNVNNGILLDKQFDCTLTILFLVDLRMAS